MELSNQEKNATKDWMMTTTLRYSFHSGTDSEIITSSDDEYYASSIFTNDDLNDFSKTLISAANMSPDKQKHMLSHLAEYTAIHTWSYEANRFISFLKNLIKDK